MRVYHLLSETDGLDDIRRRRLKVSLLLDMNDPFELLGGALKIRAHRRAFHNFKEGMAKKCGVLCFSRSWSNPVLWSHYADKHRGLCLGFEVPDQYLVPISYQAKRLEMDLERQLASGALDEKLGITLLTTKFEDWRYEDEVRMFIKPEEMDEDTGHYFFDFCAELMLKEVIIGVRSNLSLADVLAAIDKRDRPVRVKKARLAFRSFRIIENRAVR
jgi:hypothetical protein